jgi:hypothetical protein
MTSSASPASSFFQSSFRLQGRPSLTNQAWFRAQFVLVMPRDSLSQTQRPVVNILGFWRRGTAGHYQFHPSSASTFIVRAFSLFPPWKYCFHCCWLSVRLAGCAETPSSLFSFFSLLLIALAGSAPSNTTSIRRLLQCSDSSLSLNLC